MKLKTKTLLLICLSLCAMLLISGCAEKNEYEICDEEGFNVSIRFDANGGSMMNQVPAIVDTYNVADMKINADGKVAIALLDPTDERRGNGNICTPSYSESGYYLVGWYAERTENPDGEGYIYSDLWDFSKDWVYVDPKQEHSATKPVLTLYARWERMAQVEVYDRATNTLIEVLDFDPNLDKIKMPEWKKSSVKGEIDMNDMPEKEGYTFDKAYYDLEGTKPIDTETLVHTVESDIEARTMRIYVDWLEGEWYHIYTAKQLNRNADLDGNYVICDDLDFSKSSWPKDFLYGNFTGTIQTLDDAQYTFSNIVISQLVKESVAGLFGTFTSEASISNITFDNVQYTVNLGNNSQCNYGLFAGVISDGSQISNVTIQNSQLTLVGPAATGTDINYGQYLVGLICGTGYANQIDLSGVSYAVHEDSVSLIKVTADGNELYIEAL